VTCGGVTREREVVVGEGREEREGRVGRGPPPGMGMEGRVRCMGVTGREWERYQVRTVRGGRKKGRRRNR